MILVLFTALITIVVNAVTAKIDIDPLGYIAYCPCMGNSIENVAKLSILPLDFCRAFRQSGGSFPGRSGICQRSKQNVNSATLGRVSLRGTEVDANPFRYLFQSRIATETIQGDSDA